MVFLVLLGHLVCERSVRVRGWRPGGHQGTMCDFRLSGEVTIIPSGAMANFFVRR